MVFDRRVLFLGGGTGDQTITFPRARRRYRIHSITFGYVADATVANRGVQVQLKTGSIVLLECVFAVVIAASQSYLISFAEFGSLTSGNFTSIRVANCCLPFGGLIVTPDLTAQLSVVGGVVGDVFSDIVLHVSDDDQLPTAPKKF